MQILLILLYQYRRYKESGSGINELYELMKYQPYIILLLKCTATSDPNPKSPNPDLIHWVWNSWHLIPRPSFDDLRCSILKKHVKFQILFEQQKDKCKHLKFASSECCIDLVYFVISISYIQLKIFSGRAPIFQGQPDEKNDEYIGRSQEKRFYDT